MPPSKRKLDKDKDVSSDETDNVPAKRVRKTNTATKPTTKSARVLRPKRKPAEDRASSSDENDEVATKKVRKTKAESKTTTKSSKLKATDSTETSQTKVQPSDRDVPVEKPLLPTWNEADLLSETYNTSPHTMNNIVQLFREDNTIPFICRYRKELIGNITPDIMRDIKATYNQLLKLKVKQESVITKLEKANTLSDELHRNILAVKSSDELDHLYEPFKTASKTSLSEKAKSKGLLDPAEQILYGRGVVKLSDFVNAANGLDDVQSVREGLKNIILTIINKDVDVLEEIRRLLKVNTIRINSTQIKQSKSSKNDGKKSSQNADQNDGKFETYYDFHTTTQMIKPHQTLAINRGESQKILKVTVDIPDRCKTALYNFLYKKYNKDVSYSDREQVLSQSFNEYISKKLQPLITRRVRKELTKSAEKASIDVFATNLKQLLLTGPLKGQRILGIDPGFTNGCKIALISECNEVLDTDVIYPHTKTNQSLNYGHMLAIMMRKHGCTTIALGNGTACRETEKWISDLFDKGILDSKRIRYSIINEQGTSIYSCSDLAKKEFPDLDVNVISAVSVARRLADPLSELVKVEAKHLGVGMYQHDINERHLSESLDEVVTECVSFVGVNVNTSSVTLLRHVAGLTESRAENIFKHRMENGPFKSREELKKVKLIGSKTFEQCAGFLRIEPTTEDDVVDLLDSTWIHPESYILAERIMCKCGVKKEDIGTGPFIAKIKEFMQKNSSEQLAKEFKKPKERIEGVIEALERERFRDYREDFRKEPLFKQGLTKLSDLAVNATVSGAVTNVTHFGCFVDIGVGRDALIHSSQLQRMAPRIGDRVECIVLKVDADRGRINLKLTQVL
ncbi:uncharacterized protein YdcI [Bradysia coprophila]|uniref:uncharacterized protein YdcI n=1 Tax=Bradysia coprophila TaxID=38358 RepID=UPI00187DAE4F|nr:uncharacterized protein YdcI [Bradysia coprophila]